jgi:hypothetical protein
MNQTGLNSEESLKWIKQAINQFDEPFKQIKQAVIQFEKSLKRIK